MSLRGCPSLPLSPSVCVVSLSLRTTIHHASSGRAGSGCQLGSCPFGVLVSSSRASTRNNRGSQARSRCLVLVSPPSGRVNRVGCPSVCLFRGGDGVSSNVAGDVRRCVSCRCPAPWISLHPFPSGCRVFHVVHKVALWIASASRLTEWWSKRVVAAGWLS